MATESRSWWVPVAGLVVWAFWLRWTWLASEPGSFGVDGYYYAVQVRALLAGTTLPYPGLPMTFIWLAPFAAAAGVIPGIKLGAALAYALGIVPLSALLHRATGSAPAAWLGATFLVVSPNGFLLVGEFLKQGLGLTVALAASVFLLTWLDSDMRASRPFVGFVVATLLAAATHLTSVGLVGVLGMAMSLASIRRRGLLRHVLAGAGLMATVGVLAKGELLAGLFDLSMPFQLGWRAEALLAGFLAIPLLALLRRRRMESATIAVLPVVAGPIGLAVFLACPLLDTTDGYGLGLRLCLFGGTMAALIVPIVVELSGIGSTRLRSGLSITLVAAMLASFGAVWPNDDIRMPPAQLDAGFEALAEKLPGNVHLVTNRNRWAFMTTWFTGRPAGTRMPEDDHPTMILVVGRDIAPLGADLRDFLTQHEDLPVAIHGFDERPMALLAIPKETWQAFVSSLDEEQRALLPSHRGIAAP